LLGPECRLTEAQLEQVRQDLYALAQITIEGFRKRQEPKNVAPLAPVSPSARAHFNVSGAISPLLPADRDSLEERSAILEFDAGLDRDQAGKEALLEWAGRKSTQVTIKRRPRNKNC
jgi:hypothetical protein